MLLSKHEIRAVKKLVLTVVRKTFKIVEVTDADFDACQVDHSSVLVWAIREQCLHSCDTEDMKFNINT